TRRMHTLFPQLELEDLRRTEAGRLSGGMKQRLALACALVHDPRLALLVALACALVHAPRLAFLDEPTAGVDPANRQRLWDFLYALCEGGTSLFVTTHYLDEAERCHEVGFMLDGRLIGHGEPRVLSEQLRGRLIRVEGRRAVEDTSALTRLPR